MKFEKSIVQTENLKELIEYNYQELVDIVDIALFIITLNFFQAIKFSV